MLTLYSGVLLYSLLLLTSSGMMSLVIDALSSPLSTSQSIILLLGQPEDVGDLLSSKVNKVGSTKYSSSITILGNQKLTQLNHTSALRSYITILGTSCRTL